MSGLSRVAFSLVLVCALGCPAFAQSGLKSAPGFGFPVIPPPDPPADQRCQQHTVEISGIQCFSYSLHKYLSVTEECAQVVKEKNLDPLLCDRRLPRFVFESHSDEPPQGPGLYRPGFKLNPPAELDKDLAEARRIVFLQRLRAMAIPKTEPATQTSDASAPKTPTPATVSPSYLGPSTEPDEVLRLANEIKALRMQSERYQMFQQSALENIRREGAKKDKQEDAKWAMSTAGSLWVARNVTTEEATLSFLRSTTNNSPLATKVAPQVFKLFKSRPSGAMLLLAMGAGATYYLYEYFGFDESVKPVAVIRDGTVSALPRP